MGNFKGWEFTNWERFPRTKAGHDALVSQLRQIIESEYHLRLGKLDEKEECIAWTATRKPIFPHEPDLIISVGPKEEDRIFVEYVNTKGRYLQNFIRDLRGMMALSVVVKKYWGFVLAVRDSIHRECFLPIHAERCKPIEPMSLKSLFFALDRNDYDYLLGKI